VTGIISKEPTKKTFNPAEKIIKRIKGLDTGDGADFESVIKDHGDGAENLIKSLMKRGKIFELKPGKLKVLE